MSTTRLFDDNMYCFDQPQPSYWEATASDLPDVGEPLQGDASCEVAIIGGGYTGLSAAYHLAKNHQVDVRVLDAGHIGWGASGRNGGFCSMGGSFYGIDELIKHYGLDAARQHYKAQRDAVELVRDLVVSENIDARMQGDGELEVAHSPRAFSHAASTAEIFREQIGVETEIFDADEVRERFCDSAFQYGGTLQRPTFGLHRLRFAKGLAAATARRGATLHPLSEVLDWRKDGARHLLSTAAGTLRASTVVYATNGFLPERLHGDFFGVTLPLISAIVVTRPLSDDELAAHHWSTETPVFNTRPLMNYYRLLPDRRFMFGGRGHSTGDPAGSARNFERLIAALHRQWPEWRNAAIEYKWHGFICVTRRLTPCIGRLDDDDSVYFGFGYHGNGVNNSNWTGKQIADWIGSGQKTCPESIPALMRGLADRFPLPGLRLRYLQTALTWKRVVDRFS